MIHDHEKKLLAVGAYAALGYGTALGVVPARAFGVLSAVVGLGSVTVIVLLRVAVEMIENPVEAEAADE